MLAPRSSWSRWPLALVACLALSLLFARPARADDDPAPGDEHAQPAGEPAAAAPDTGGDDQAAQPAAAGEDHAAQPAGGDDHAGEAPAADPAPAANPDHDQAAAVPDGDSPAAGAATADGAEAGGDPYAGDVIPPRLEYDADGDGVVEPAEQALQKEWVEAFKDLPQEVTEKGPGEIDLAHPAMTAEQFKKLVGLAKAKVLARLTAKMAKKQAARMSKLSKLIAYFSLSGLLLLFLPLALKKKYPGKTGMLFKYSGLAAVTFIVTVNFFGGVVLGMRTVQGALGGMTNPQLKVAEGFFDSLAADPDKYLPFAKDLFAPTLQGLTSAGAAEQPAVALIENGQKLMKDAKVFITVAKTFKKIDFVFAALPIILLVVTMLLFVLAIKPTLTEIVKMPASVAAGDQRAAGAAVRNAGRRIGGEIVATLCTIGVLVVVSVVATLVLGRLLLPALDLLIQYFATGVLYLQLKTGASSGLVFVMLISVIVFLALNLAAVILGMAFFLGKAQKIFQQRFTENVPLGRHARFWKWGVASVLATLVIPLVWMLVANKLVIWMSEKFIGGEGGEIAWGKLMLVGPLVLVFGFLVVFWAARGVQAIKFLFTYKVKEKPAKTPALAAAGASMMPPPPPYGMPPAPPAPPTRPSGPELPR